MHNINHLCNLTIHVTIFYTFVCFIVVNCYDVPEPATPTVAAPAPMNLAAESISRVTDVVWNDRTWGKSATGFVFCAANVWLWLMTALFNGRKYDPLAN